MIEDKAHSDLFRDFSQELLSNGRSVRFQARGGSMWPTICDGEVLHIEPVLPEQLHRGDIVLFAEGKHFRAHRLVSMDWKQNIYLTRGDSGEQMDAPLRAEQILGRVVAKEEYSGGAPRVVQLCGTRAKARFLVRQSRNLISRTVPHSSILTGAKMLTQKRIFAAVGLFLLLALLFSGQAVGQVAVDASTSATGYVRTTGGATTITFTHTATGTNRLVVVGVSMNITAPNTAATVSSVTYGGTAMTRAGFQADATPTRRVEMWYLVAPATGLQSIVITFTGLTTTRVGVVAGATSFTGADQTTPVRSFTSAFGNGGALSSLNASSAFGDQVIDTLSTGYDQTLTFGPSQTSQWNAQSGTGYGAAIDVRGGGSIRSGAPSVPMTETFSGTSNWAQAALSIRPYSADLSVTNVATSAVFPAAISYLITVTNNGPSTANAVTLTDTVASGLTGVTAIPSGTGSCTVTLPTINCSLGNIANGASVTVTVTGTPGATGGYPNTATVPTTLAPPDYNGNNNSAMAVAFSQATTCSSTTPPAASGPLAGVINTYFPPASVNTIVAASAKTVTLGTYSGAYITGGITSAGDEFMFIQMQDAAINPINGSTYGDGISGAGSTSLNYSGIYEFVTATNSIPLAGGTLNFTGSGPGGGLLYSYTNAAPTATQGQRRFQVIRVPQYSTATLGTNLTAIAWDGNTGGVFALDIAGTLSLGSMTVDVNGKGFRGGAGLQLSGNAAAINTDYQFASPATYNYTGVALPGAQGSKAEGIAGTPLWVESNSTFLNTGSGYPSGIAGTDGSMARGAPGNAGGGGTDGNPGGTNNQNSGGGGGGNGGVGGAGGNAWQANLSVGGYGGSPFAASPIRVVMGGGGGAGSRNDDPNDNLASSGAAGGGIVIIRAGSLVGTATISANGANAYNLTSNDAAGGGGAGGSVIVLSQSGGEGGLTITANGGRGGNAWATDTGGIADRHGPGGGGGGGVVLVSGAPASMAVTGGVNGTTTTGLYPYGATSGGAGVTSTNASISGTPGNQSAACFSDLTITKTHVGNFVQGTTGTYTITVHNASALTSTSLQVTVTDTIPAGIGTLSGASGPGWACNVISPTLTCGRSDALAPGANYPVITVLVAVTGAAGTVTNTATVQGGGELNDLNDTANDPTTIVAATAVVISKTASAASVMTGSNFVYTLVVTNRSGGTRTNVTVTDPLPTGVTYVSYTSTQGTCAGTTTVTCTITGTMAVNAVVTITITVRAGAPAQVTNTATVTTTVPTTNSATVTTTITFTPSEVTLEAFTAAQTSEGVLLAWKTGEEVRNLGFHVYREQNGERVRLNPALIAGSALRFRGGLPQHGGKSYSWMDRSANAANASYWLEDVDLDGTRTMHGPVTAEGQPVASSYFAAKSMARAATMAEMNRTVETAAVAPASTFIADQDTSASHIMRPVLIVPGRPVDRQTVQTQLAARQAVKIFVDHEGWYRITQPELLAAGLSPWTDPRTLQLFAEGMEQSIRVTGTTGGYGSFGAQAAIEFYGTGIDTPFSGQRVYWLVAGQTAGRRISQATGFGSGGQEPQSFPRTIELKQRTTYYAALLRDGTDNFFGALVSPTPVDQTLTVTNLAASGENGQLQVVLQGVRDKTAHNVQISLNGATLGSLDFAGQNEGVANFLVPSGLLKEGTNTVTLTGLYDEYDYSLVDYIRLTYPHSYTAESGALEFSASAGDHVVVHGFLQSAARLLDVTNPAAPVLLAPQVRTENGGFALDARVPSYPFGARTLLAVTENQFQKPAQLAANVPSNWNNVRTGAVFVIVTSAQFASQVAPLAQLRRSQGKTVAVATVDDVYDEFNFGERSPQAIQDFLKTAIARWSVKPRYLLLVGDASVDPRNYLGFGDFDFVPTKIVATTALKTSSDDWFSDFTNTGTAQIATGRLPVRTTDDAQTVVSKIVNYESSTQAESWTNQVMLVANQNDTTADFIQQAQSIQTLLPSSIAVTDVFGGSISPSAAKQEILDGINSGKLLVNYNGHGSVEVWSGDTMMDSNDAASLTNGAHLPVFLLMNCLNGFFHDVYTHSLAESLLLSKNGGAVAVWASSGLTSPEPQFQMDRAVVNSLFSQSSIALGDAIKNAKAGISDPDVRRTFILFGDPLLRIKRGNTMSNVVRIQTPVKRTAQ